VGSSIEITDLTVSYKGFTAVDGVSFTVDRGQTLVLLGPSGCGKSSLLNAIAGFVPITSGSVKLGGREITAAPPQHRRMSMVFQTHALFPHLTVLGNVAFGLKVWRGPKLSKGERESRALAALRLVHLDDKASRYPDSLSGGERQRVAIARALVVDPEVLLLDEPLSSLDARLREELRYELSRISAEQHLTMIYVTHDQEEAFALGDQIAVMRAGKVQQRSTGEEIYREPRTPFVARFVGGSNLLPCRVLEGSSAGHALVDLGGETATVRNPWGVVDGAEAFIALRDHAIDVRAEASGTAGRNSVPATVTLARYMGSSGVVGVERPDGLALRARLPASRPIDVEPGQQVFVEWDRESGTLLKEEA